MREKLWLWLRDSSVVRRLYALPMARQPMTALSYVLVPSQRKCLLSVRRGPASGLRFEINPRWERHLWEGQHELDVQQILADRLKPGSIFYDIGAGFGFYTALAARLGAQVFAFEPDEANAKSVRRHVQVNALGRNVEIMQMAVLAASGNTGFESAPQERGHGNGRASRENPSLPSVVVVSVSLDDFFPRHPAPTLIKIDVEGAESEVLKGAAKLFNQCRPDVICEVHDPRNTAFVENWLRARQYSVSRIGEQAEYPFHVVAVST